MTATHLERQRVGWKEDATNQGGTGAAGSAGAGQTAGQGQGQAGGKVAGGDTELTVEQVKTLVSLP